MKKKIWIIEQGDYSDYHVVGIFSNLADAQTVADRVNSSLGKYMDLCSVTERVLDPHISEINEGLSSWFIVMDYDGTTEKIEKIDDISYWRDLGIWKRITAPAYKGENINDAINGRVWARDKMHAIKIANEYRAQMIASGELERNGKGRLA